MKIPECQKKEIENIKEDLSYKNREEQIKIAYKKGVDDTKKLQDEKFKKLKKNVKKNLRVTGEASVEGHKQDLT